MQYEIKCVIKTVDRVIDRNEERGVSVRVLGCDYNSPELAVLRVSVKNPLLHGSKHDTINGWSGQRLHYQGD